MSKEISIRIVKYEEVEWRKIKDLQPTNFKTHHSFENVKNSITTYGFSSAFYVWENPITKDIFFVDGHTRSDVLIELQSDGFTIPEKLPCVFIYAANEKEAILLLLTIFNQRQSKILESSLIEFIAANEITLNEIKMLDIDYWVDRKYTEDGNEGEESMDFSGKNKEIDLDDFENEMTLKFLFSRERFNFANQKLNELVELLNVENKEDVLIHLLENHGNK